MGAFGFTMMIVGTLIAIVASIGLSCVVKGHLQKMIRDAEAKANKEAKVDSEKPDIVVNTEKCNPQNGSSVELEQIGVINGITANELKKKTSQDALVDNHRIPLPGDYPYSVPESFSHIP